MAISFNAQYVLDFLNVVETDIVSLSLKDEVSQAVMKPVGAEGYDYTYVIMIFSDRGRAYWLKVHHIPDVGPDGRGKAIANLVSMEDGERIAALLTVREFEDNKFIVMGTKRGVVKKTELNAFSNPRAGGIIAMMIGVSIGVVSGIARLTSLFGSRSAPIRASPWLVMAMTEPPRAFASCTLPIIFSKT